MLCVVAGELISSPAAAIARLTGAARALTIVIWRDRPDPMLDEAVGKGKQPQGAGSVARANQENAESDTALGSVPWAYYSYDLLSSNAPPPGHVPVYEDLTVGCDSVTSRAMPPLGTTP
jgi:hypothetical protein